MSRTSKHFVQTYSRDFSLVAGGHEIAIQRISVEPESASPPLVFLHEGLGCIGMWKDIPERLAQVTGCSVVVYDRAGHGASERVKKPRGPDYFADEANVVLHHVLQQLEIESPVLVGHSDGATIALHYAAGHSVTGIVSEAAHVFVEPVSIDGVDNALSAWRQGDLREKLRRYHGANTDSMFQAWADMWRGEWFRDWSIESILPDITAPVLVLQGEKDEYGTDAQVHAIAAGVGGPVETRMIADCGHIPHFQARGAYEECVCAFIDRICDAGR